MMGLGFFSLISIVILGACGTKDSYLLWTDSLAGIIGGAVLSTQAPPLKGSKVKPQGREFPESLNNCPEIFDTDSTLVDCRDFQSDKIIDSPGKYMRRYLGLCQFDGLQMMPWWRTYQRIEFPDQATCELMKNTDGGFSSANVLAASLVSNTIKINFGLGPNADEQNIVFSPDGDIQYLWTDFPTGFVESREGGFEVTFTASNERSIMIKGIQVKNYKPVNGEVNNPLNVYVSLQDEPVEKVITLASDKTFASIRAGDRQYEREDAVLDFQYADDYPLIVKYSGSTPVVLSGAKIRTQFNSRGAMGLSTITEDMRYEDPTCCWPTSGKITTVFNSLYNLPTVRKKSFMEETITFQSTCGAIELTQTGGDAGSDIPPRPLELSKCY
ncbi:MAG: hypothetical protein EBR01_05140 [Proteobacteria bacterium]|nr:hypothetical protein [Pseudomonadota bacterium]